MSDPKAYVRPDSATPRSVCGAVIRSTSHVSVKRMSSGRTARTPNLSSVTIGETRQVTRACARAGVRTLGHAHDHPAECAITPRILRRVSDRVLVRELLRNASVDAGELAN